MNNIHRLDLNLLAVLDALFKEGSVTKAAQELGMTQSAMSHALNRLREFFDDQLFVRAGNSMVPTRKAKDMQSAVIDVMAVVRQQILSGVSFEAHLAQRTFTLCMTDMGELVFLPPLLERLKRKAPGCSIRTLQVPIEQVSGLLASGDADLALGSLRTAPQDLYKQRLFQHSFVTVVNANNPQIGTQLSREQFESMPHVVVSLTGRTSESYDSTLEELGIKRKVAVITPHFLMVPLLVERSPELIAIAPLELARVFARYGAIRFLETPVPLPDYSLNQHWHPRFHHDPAIVWLRDLVKSTFERYPDIILDDDRSEPHPNL